MCEEINEVFKINVPHTKIDRKGLDISPYIIRNNIMKRSMEFHCMSVCKKQGLKPQINSESSSPWDNAGARPVIDPALIEPHGSGLMWRTFVKPHSAELQIQMLVQTLQIQKEACSWWPEAGWTSGTNQQVETWIMIRPIRSLLWQMGILFFRPKPERTIHSDANNKTRGQGLSRSRAVPVQRSKVIWTSVMHH